MPFPVLPVDEEDGDGCEEEDEANDDDYQHLDAAAERTFTYSVDIINSEK